MITSLSRLSLLSFIELSCGNNEILREHKEESIEDLRSTASELLYKYQGIINPSGLETLLMDKEERLKVQYRLSICKVLRIMIGIGAHDEVNKVLKGMGYNETEPGMMIKRIDRMNAEAEYLKHRIDDNVQEIKKRTADEVRASFDKEIAFLMTYFKMNIDVNIISAGVYANMLRQADFEIKQKMVRK